MSKKEFLKELLNLVLKLEESDNVLENYMTVDEIQALYDKQVEHIKQTQRQQHLGKTYDH